MLEHLHASDDIKAGRHLGGQDLDGHLAIAQPFLSSLHRVQLRNPQGLGRQVNAQNIGAARSHRLAQDAAAASHIESCLAGQSGLDVNPVQAQRIDLVQGPKFAVGVPPVVGKLAKLGQLLRICVQGCHGRIVMPASSACVGCDGF